VRVGVAITAVACLAAVAAPVGLPSGTPAGAAQTAASPRATATVRIAPIHSSLESSTRSISRDIGISVALPDGHAVWIFGDTGVWKRSGKTWELSKFIDGSSAMLVKSRRGQVPTGTEYPQASPTRFLPTPNAYLPDGSGRRCKQPLAAFAARWPTGAALFPSNDSFMLITYSIVCITMKGKSPVINTQGWGYSMYNWRHSSSATAPRDIVKPQASAKKLQPSQVLGQPMFEDGKLTLFAASCESMFVDCLRGRVWSVTMPPTTAALDKVATYPTVEVPTDGSATWKPLAMTVARFPSGLRLLETTSIKGTYRIYEAPSIAGPWHLRRSGTLPGCPTKTRFCFALEGHPELSTATQLFVSYKRPNTEVPAGHIVVSALPD
jgi:hypothetical protein